MKNVALQFVSFVSVAVWPSGLRIFLLALYSHDAGSVLRFVGVWMDGVAERRVHKFRDVEEKRRIVEETLRDGTSVSSVARANGVNANQVFQWRRLYRDGLLDAAPSGNEILLLPVAVSDESRAGVAGLSATEPLDEPVTAGPSLGMMELTFAWGRLRITGAVDAGTLRTVLGYLLT